MSDDSDSIGGITENDMFTISTNEKGKVPRVFFRGEEVKMVFSIGNMSTVADAFSPIQMDIRLPVRFASADEGEVSNAIDSDRTIKKAVAIALNHAICYHDIAKPEVVSDDVLNWNDGENNLELVIGSDSRITFLLFENGKNTKEVCSFDDAIFNIRQSFVYTIPRDKPE